MSSDLRLLCLLCLLCASSTARADDALKTLLEEERSLLSGLERTTNELAAADVELAELKKEAPVLGYRLQELRRQTDALKRRIDLRQHDTKRHIRALYKLSQGGYVRLLLDAPNRREMLFRSTAAARLFERDVGELRAHKRAFAALQRLRSRLQRLRDRQLSRIQSLRLQQSKRKELRSELHRRHERLRGDRRARQRLARDLSQAERDLLQQIDRRPNKSTADSFLRHKGRLSWPVAGRVVGRFGQIKEAETRLPIARSGVTLRCGRAATVRAAYAGVVRLSGPLAGYGRIVLLEHAGGYYTVYAFLGATTVEQGKRVEQGTALGHAGTDPLDGRSALYFELRQGRHAEDPLPWLRSRAAVKQQPPSTQPAQ